MDRSNQALYQDPCWFGLGRTKSSLQRARIDSDADQESAEQQIRHRHEHCGHHESHPAKVTSRFPQNHSQYPDFLQESDHNHSIATAYEYRAPEDSFQRAKNHKKRFPSFGGCLEEEEFLEWLQEVEDFFLFYGVSEETKVAHVVRRLKDKAFSWWDQIQLDRIRIGKFPIFTWKRMKRYLCRKFVPAYFEQLMFEQNPRNHQNPNFLPTIQSQIFPLRSSHKHSSFTSQQSTKFCYPRQDTQFSLLTNSGVNIGCQEKFREVAQETNVEYHNQVGDYKFVQLEDIMSSNFRGNEDDLVEDKPFLDKNIMEAYSHENDKIAARELSICLESGLDIAAEDGLAARECQEKITTSSCLLDLVIPDLKDEPLVQKTPKLPANMSQYSTRDEAKENLLERTVLESDPHRTKFHQLHVVLVER